MYPLPVLFMTHGAVVLKMVDNVAMSFTTVISFPFLMRIKLARSHNAIFPSKGSTHKLDIGLLYSTKVLKARILSGSASPR